MKTLTVVAAICVCFGTAFAYQEFSFHCVGSGNMIMFDQPVYSGTIDGGDLAPGLWWMHVDDTGWPPASNPQLRWAYVWQNYYDYDPSAQIWTGMFDCTLDLEHIGYGTMHGICDLTFQLIDLDGDMILDPEECANGLSGAVIIIHEGTGVYSELCGDGNYEGGFFRVCDEGPDWMNDFVDFQMYLDLEECGMAAQPSTWAAVKALFK